MSPRLLVVEDRDSLRRMLEHALAGEGYGVETAADVGAARERIAAAGLELVLTDLKLPDGSGLEVVRACRDADPPVPVVVMTAFGSVSTAVEAMKAGAFDYILKPFKLQTLLLTLARAMGGVPAAQGKCPARRDGGAVRIESED